MAELGSRDEYWADMVAECRASSLSQKEFCRQRGISDRALNNWLYKSPYRERVARILAARSQETPNAATRRFLPVEVLPERSVIRKPEVPTAPAIEVVLPSGPRIVVTAGFDAETLRRVVETLEARPC